MLERQNPTERFNAHLRHIFGTGLVLLIPAVITYLVLKFVFNGLDDILQPFVRRAFGREIPGLGVVALVLLVYLIGLVGANYFGRRALRVTSGLLVRIPVLGVIYRVASQFTESLSGIGESSFKRAVMVEWPTVGTGVWTFAFITGTSVDENGKTMVFVYIPAGPSPHTGLIVLMPTEQIRDTDLKGPDALQMFLSAGVIAPKRVNKRPFVL